jgi:vancomycin resistance protein YoaR
LLAALLLAMLSTLVLVGGVALAWQRHYAWRVVPGVWVAGIPLQGLTAPEAEAALREAWGEVGPRHLVLRDGDRRWVLPLDELGIGWDIAATVRAVMAVGHTGSFVDDWLAWLRGLRRGVVVPAFWTLDEGRANLALHTIAGEIDRPARPATLELSGAAPRSEPAVYGRALDVAATRAELSEALRAGLPENLDLTIRSLPPSIVDGEAARERAERLLSQQVILVYEEDGTRHSWSLGRDAIRQGLRPRQEAGDDGLTRWALDFDSGAVAEWVAAIARQVDRPLIEGRVRLDLQTLQASVAVPSQSGRQVDVEETLGRVLAALEGGEAVAEMAVEVTRPYVTAAEVARWGRIELLSEGKTHFAGSAPGRKQNIVIGASRYEGIVVPPGATFSFNQYVGPVTLADGWAEAYVIRGDRTELDAGGGLCQVATTVYRAAFFGGFPIVTRYPHTYRVSWYEPPIGLDATVYTPWVDFRFRNDLAIPVIIQPAADTRKGVLTFRFYGPGLLGRTVEMEGPHLDRHTKAPPPIYEEDPTLEPGEIKQVDSARAGVRATVYRIIKQGDEVIAREAFVSEYQAWPARYKVGPQRGA